MMSESERTELTRDDLLVLLVEECGEVIQAATKCLRFGYDVDHGTGYGNIAAAMIHEMRNPVDSMADHPSYANGEWSRRPRRHRGNARAYQDDDRKRGLVAI